LSRIVAIPVQAKFTLGTGDILKPDIKVLVQVRAVFHPRYGFDLIIEDIDPSYTLGDLITRVKAIRAALKAEGIYHQNRQQSSPTNFFRVAVISPSTSAGQGDFRSEADRLHHIGLCAFDYFAATFQGNEAPKSIRNAIREMFERHKVEPYDALAIIRGGGSATDLAWLNDLTLARWICRIPIPVFTGIGHQRDITILDEVAHRRFDTPSKVALHISQTIRLNALETCRYIEQIEQITRRALIRRADDVESLRRLLEERSRHSLATARSAIDHLARQVGLSAAYRCHEAEAAFERAKRQLTEGSAGCLREAAAAAVRALESLGERARSRLITWAAHTQSLIREVRTKSEAKVLLAARSLDGAHALITARSEAAIGTARMQMDHCIEQIVGMGPEATLRRGYAIARDQEGRPVASASQALLHKTMTIQFRDGDVPVENRAFPKGAES
jgi:exodeoxyribonuclease VII large subunit